MEHDKHIHEFEQDLHETVKRVSSAYKKAAPNEELLRSVLAKLPPAAPAVPQAVPSPYARFFALDGGIKYLVPAVLVVVLVAVVSLRGTTNAPARLAQETSAPESAPIVMMVEDAPAPASTGEDAAMPTLMMAPNPALEDAAGTRMMVPSAKVAQMNSGGTIVSSEDFISATLSDTKESWSAELWRELSFKIPPRYRVEVTDTGVRIMYANEVFLDAGSSVPLSLDIRAYNKDGYRPSDIQSIYNGSRIEPTVESISCNGVSYSQESFELGGAENEERQLRRFTVPTPTSVYELFFSFSTCGYCREIDPMGRAAQDEFALKNTALMCDILSSFSVVQ